VAQQLLDAPDVDTGLEQMRREGMTQCMRRHSLRDIGTHCGTTDGPRDRLGVQVMSAAKAC
jgi:hypothetical protein